MQAKLLLSNSAHLARELGELNSRTRHDHVHYDLFTRCGGLSVSVVAYARAASWQAMKEEMDGGDGFTANYLLPKWLALTAVPGAEALRDELWGWRRHSCKD